jgi:WD40 repeat protein
LFNKGVELHIASIVVLVLSLACGATRCHAQQAKKPFTVADEVGLTLFGTPAGGRPEVHFSPDGNYLAVRSTRGRLDINYVEDSLRIYRSQDVMNFVDHSDESRPSPVWTITRTGKEDGVIEEWRWITDSSGVAFLERTVHGNQRLFLADLRKKTVDPLTSATESVKDFDVRDKQQYVYVATDSVEEKKLQEKIQAERQAPVVVGTGRSLSELLFPDDPQGRQLSLQSYLWAVFKGKRFEVKQNGEPISPDGGLALSPDGGSLVTMPSIPDARIWNMVGPCISTSRSIYERARSNR